MTAPVTIDLDEKTLTALDNFAANMEQSRSGMINLALQEWLAAQVDIISDIKAGIADADAGRFASDEEVAAVFAKYGVNYGAER